MTELQWNANANNAMHRSWRPAGFHIDNHSRQPGDCERYATELDRIVLNRLWKRRVVRKIVYATTTFAVLSSTLCWYFGINSTSDLKAYVGMALECHPVWKDLALHHIREGRSVDDVIAATKPVYVVRHGRFIELGYQEPLSFTAVQMIAIDGKLVRAGAGSCGREADG